MSKRKAFKAALARAGSTLTTPYEQVVARKYSEDEARDSAGRWTGSSDDDLRRFRDQVIAHEASRGEGKTGADVPPMRSGSIDVITSLTAELNRRADEREGKVSGRATAYSNNDSAKRWLSNGGYNAHDGTRLQPGMKTFVRQAIPSGGLPGTDGKPFPSGGNPEAQPQPMIWHGTLKGADANGITVTSAGKDYNVPHQYVGYVGADRSGTG